MVVPLNLATILPFVCQSNYTSYKASGRRSPSSLNLPALIVSQYQVLCDRLGRGGGGWKSSARSNFGIALEVCANDGAGCVVGAGGDILHGLRNGHVGPCRG